MNFIPDSGKYEIVSFICTCYGEVNLGTPMRRSADEVIGWTCTGVDHGETPHHLPLAPVTLDDTGPQVVHLVDSETIGAPRLAKIGECTMTHAELISLHRAYHEQD